SVVSQAVQDFRGSDAVTAALTAEKNRLSLPTFYEREEARHWTQAGLLNAYHQNNLAFDLPEVTAGAADGMTVTANGRFLLAAKRDNTFLIWDIIENRAVLNLPPIQITDNTKGYEYFAVSGNGEYFVFSNGMDRLEIWSVAEKKLHKILQTGKYERGTLALNYDGSVIYVQNREQNILSVDVATEKTLDTIPHKTFSADIFTINSSGTKLILSSWVGESKISVVDLISKNTFQISHSGEIKDVAFSNDQTRIYSISRDGIVKVSDASDGHEVASFAFELPNNISSIKIKALKDQVAILLNDERFDIWDIESKTKTRSLQRNSTDSILSFAITPTLDRIYSGGAKGVIKSWPLNSCLPDSITRLDEGKFWDLKLSMDGRELFSVASDESIKVWDVQTFKLLRTIKIDNFIPLRVKQSDDGKFLAVIGKNVQLIELSTGQSIMTFDGHFKGIDSVAISPDSTILGTGSKDFSLKLWKVSDGTQLQTMSNPFTSDNLTFSKDGKKLISNTGDTLNIWEVATGKKLHTLNRHLSGVNFFQTFRDGERFFSGSGDQTIRTWDIETGSNLQTFTVGGSVFVLLLTEDEKTFLALDSMGPIRLLDAKTGERMATINQSQNFTDRMIITKDGNRLLLSAYDGRIKTWDLSAAGLRSKLCKLAVPIIDANLCN
ncbi:MAG: hypothetical protein EOP04_12500, partial [Proteobacteria bacterium]